MQMCGACRVCVRISPTLLSVIARLSLSLSSSLPSIPNPTPPSSRPACVKGVLCKRACAGEGASKLRTSCFLGAIVQPKASSPKAVLSRCVREEGGWGPEHDGVKGEMTPRMFTPILEGGDINMTLKLI